MAEREEKVKIHRILEIDKEIRAGNYPNSTSLKTKFEVSRATIMRDIEFLRDRYEAPLEYDSLKNGYYYSDKNFFIQSVMLSEGELFTVSTIMPLLEQYKNTPLEESFKKIMNKITEMLPDQISVDSSFMNDEIKFISDPLPKIDEEIFNKVFKAAKTQNTIEYSYKSLKRQDYATRKLNPYQVLCQKGNWYICGYCHTHNDIRIYALSRIKNLEITNEKFKPDPDFKIEKYIDPSFGVWTTNEEPQKIELLFDKNINTYILERTWHATQEIKQNDDGSVLLSFMTNQLQETLHWVLSFGSSVQVLNPPKLVELVKEEAEKILKKMNES